VENSVTAEQATEDNMAHAHCMLQTHSEYVIIIAFLGQECLQQRASMLRHTCMACLVITEMGCSLRGTTWVS